MVRTYRIAVLIRIIGYNVIGILWINLEFDLDLPTKHCMKGTKNDRGVGGLVDLETRLESVGNDNVLPG